MLKSISSAFQNESIDLSKDYADWIKLSNDERHFIKNILAFFASSDGIIIENLISRFMVEIQSSEIRAFYSFQNFMENVHSETYSLLIDTYIKDSNEKHNLFNALENFPCIKKKRIGLGNGLVIIEVLLQLVYYHLQLLREYISVQVLLLFFG